MAGPADADAVLLAVDTGLRTGLALFGRRGRLLWYRSRHFADHAALRRAAQRLLAETQPAHVYLEGGGTIANLWTTVAARRAIAVTQIPAETWRSALLLDRDQRSGRRAKERAGTLARQVIDWSQAPRPTALRHDAAEAILLGLWAVLDLGWLERLPEVIRP